MSVFWSALRSRSCRRTTNFVYCPSRITCFLAIDKFRKVAASSVPSSLISTIGLLHYLLILCKLRVIAATVFFPACSACVDTSPYENTPTTLAELPLLKDFSISRQVAHFGNESE